ncbi:helix-turn-helix domain-containing protein [Nonomuraea sp. NPDC049784]|uniref:PucR family transcriptional regulator n=1 Tax=Nonomuraea sp. NPDC049784 TaxID=3154361 RepID=UPI0033F60121
MSRTRATGWEAPITVAELVNAGPLAGARMYGTGENQVHQVRIVDELSVFGQVAPHTAVVLIGTAASGGWAVEMAMRRAWEQAAACVIAPSGRLSAGSGEVLAERLGVTLIFVDEDPLIVAVRVASAAARPEAARTQLVARCATRLAEAGPSARRVLGVLNAELPGTSVTLLDRYGRHLAGARPVDRPGTDRLGTETPGGGAMGADAHGGGDRGAEPLGGGGPGARDESGEPRGTRDGFGGEVVPGDASRPVADDARAGSPARDTPGDGSDAGGGASGASMTRNGKGGGPMAGRGEDGGPGVGRRASGESMVREASDGRAQGTRWSAEVEVPDLDGGVLGTLVAGGSSRSPGWPAAVRTVLKLAVAPLAAWAAQERLRTSRDFALQQALAERLLAEAPAEPDEGGPRAEAIALGWPVEGTLTGYQIRPTAEAADAPLARTLITATLGQVPVLPRGEGWAGWSALGPGELAERLARCLETMPWPCVAGVGAQVEGLRSVGESLLGAEAAAFVAGPGTVARADRMGPAELLGALPTGVLRTPASVVLRPLLAVDKDGTLLETLAAVLDEGGALKAAERLGVHRNTITTRLERVKSVGFDLDDAATRLALQLACHVLLR